MKLLDKSSSTMKNGVETKGQNAIAGYRNNTLLVIFKSSVLYITSI